jgi:hypothetical protein
MNESKSIDQRQALIITCMDEQIESNQPEEWHLYNLDNQLIRQNRYREHHPNTQNHPNQEETITPKLMSQPINAFNITMNPGITIDREKEKCAKEAQRMVMDFVI